MPAGGWMRLFHKLMCMAAPCLLMAGMGAPLSAQETPSETPYKAETAQAQATGTRLYRYDQAAWFATDRFLADLQETVGYDMAWLRGYLVLDGANGALDVVYYGEEGGALLEAARYQVAGDGTVSGAILETGARGPLSDIAGRMARAKSAAEAGMAQNDYRICANAQPNAVVLPPDDAGQIAVYVLTPMTSPDAYPLGGHYRFTIAADGTIAEARGFLNTCLAVPFGPPQSDGEPVGFVATHLLDAYPTEIHFFASHYVPVAVYVATTQNDLLWVIANGRLQGAVTVDNRSGEE